LINCVVRLWSFKTQADHKQEKFAFIFLTNERHYQPSPIPLSKISDLKAVHVASRKVLELLGNVTSQNTTFTPSEVKTLN